MARPRKDPTMRFLRARPVRPFALALAAIVTVTVLGLLLLWPDETEPGLSQGLAGETERAEVVSVRDAECPGPPQPTSCRTLEVTLLSGPEEGRTTSIDLGAGGLVPDVEPGDEVRLVRADPPAPGAPAAYSLADFERRGPMLWLALAFVVLVVGFGRLRGALSLLGLGLSLGVVLVFIVPAILEGSSPVLVAVIGSLAVMLLTISLAHGLGPKSVAAMLGTTVSLVAVALLALAFTELTHLTGLASEEAAILGTQNAGLSLDGLLLAGMVVGALGVLDDVTVSQASTVIALRKADPGLGARELYRRATAVGRDHVSATVNTLVLAYVGAALPILLIFSSSQVGFLDAINGELVAKEIVAMLVGSIGLIAAVPITTALAARLSVALVPDSLVADEAGHSH
jgi:uncharacterized membrane protein